MFISPLIEIEEAFEKENLKTGGKNSKKFL